MIHFKILHPLNFSGMAGDRIVRFFARVGPRSISLVMTNCPPSGGDQGHERRLNFWANKCYYLENGARDILTIKQQ